MFLELGFLELSWTWTWLELFWNCSCLGVFGPSFCQLLYLFVRACTMWLFDLLVMFLLDLLFGLLWMGWQFNLYRGCLFEKGSAQLSYQDWLITPRVQKTTPPRNFLSLKFRSQMFQVTGNQLQTFRNRFETLFQFVVGFCLDDPNLRGLGFPRSQAGGADTWYPLGFYPNTQKVWTPRPCPEDKPLVPVPLT